MARFDIDDHAMIGVDQVVIGIGEEGVSLACACPLCRQIGSRDEFRRHWRRGSERRLVESGKVLLRGANRVLLDLLRLPVLARNRSLLVGVGRDQAGVDRKPVGANQALSDTALHHVLEQPTQRIALAKAPVSVLRERRVIRNSAVQSEPAEME
jgi:hypothetical protein